MSEIHDRDSQLYTIQDTLDWIPPQQYRIISGGVLNINNRMLIFGDEGSWKSMMAMHTGYALARGSKWLGFTTYPANVLRLQVELAQGDDKHRLEKYCIGSMEIYLARDKRQTITSKELDALDIKSRAWAYPANAISRTENFIHIDESAGWESLRRNIQSCMAYLPQLPLVVILDPLFKMFNRNLSEETDLKPLLDKIDLIMAEVTNPRYYTQTIPGLSFIIIHHTRKSKTDDKGRAVAMGSQDATGSRALLRWVDTILRIDPDPNNPTKVYCTFTKHRNAEGTLPKLTLKWHKDTLHPQILSRTMPNYDDDDEMEVRGELDIADLE